MAAPRAVPRAAPRFSLKQIGYFLAVAEAGSFRAASERLNIAQTALAQALTDLEQELGIALVMRHRSVGVILTAAGMRFLGEARCLLEAADGLYSVARGWEHSPDGRLAIGCYTTMAPLLIPRSFAGFKHLHPAVELELIEGSSDQLRAGLRTGLCELALLYAFGLDDDIAHDLLYSLHPYLVIHEGHPLAEQKEIDLNDIVHEPFILFDMAPSASNTLEIFAQAGLQPKIAYRTSDFELARALAANGLGYTMLLQKPASVISYDGSRVIMRPVFGVQKRYPVVLAWAKSTRLTRRALAFRSFCQDTIAIKEKD